jgi:hypothetical protein
MRSATARILLALAIVAGMGAGFWFVAKRPTGPTPVELANAALSAPTLAEKTAAAAKLADYGDAALTSLRCVASESTEPAVKAVCLEGLANLWDYESMDQFLELAETGPERVRGRAAQAAMQLTGRQRPYLSSASEAERRLLVRHMRDDWAEIQKATHEDREELKRRLRTSHERRL